MNDLLSAEPGADWEELAPHLDGALGELSEPDRDALLLRYFERKSARDIATTLGTTEEAAQKRVRRAVERLRESLSKRGVTTGAGGLVMLLSANAVQSAPVGLALSITTSAALAGTAAGLSATAATTKVLAMTTLQKTLLATSLAVAVGIGTYEVRQASRLRAEVKRLEQKQAAAADASKDAALMSLQAKVELLQNQTGELSAALAQANADKARLQAEREQARHSATLFKELATDAASRNKNSTDEFPTPRHVWVGWGRLARLAAEFNQDDSKLSPEEKSAKEAAKADALGEVAKLMQAMKQFQLDKSAGGDSPEDNGLDDIACVLYGALNLDEQQFGKVYALGERYRQEAKEKGFSTENTSPEAVDARKQMMDAAKAELVALLTPEQAKLLDQIMPYLQVEPGKFGVNFHF